MTYSPSSTSAHVRGHSVHNRPASLLVETAAFLADAGIALALFSLVVRFITHSEYPTVWWLPAFVLTTLGLWAGQKILRGRTLGDLLYARNAPVAILLTVVCWTAPFIVAYRSYSANPLWLHAETWRLSAFMPTKDRNWVPTPFFFSLGMWPKTFESRPVFYSLPYEKGPPSRFAGHITARWINPDVSVTFEGPKTPEGGLIPRDVIRQCLTGSVTGTPLDCLRVRSTVLERHLREIRKIGPSEWKLRWFVVDNPALPADEQTQGFFISGSHETQLQSRFIAITRRGSHQAFILDAIKTPESARAAELFEQAMGSVRVSDELNPGRAWINQQLGSVRMEELTRFSGSDALLEKLAEVQAMLIAKISVEPKTYESYFHLAGTALLLARHGHQRQQNDLAAIAKPLIAAAHRYAKDVAPAEPRNSQLQNFVTESLKY